MPGLSSFLPTCPTLPGFLHTGLSLVGCDSADRRYANHFAHARSCAKILL